MKNIIFAGRREIKRVLKQILRNLARFINAHPKLKAKSTSILNYFPAVKSRLKRADQTYHYTPINHITCSEQLSPRAKKIYNDLKAAIEQRQGDVQ